MSGVYFTFGGEPRFTVTVRVGYSSVAGRTTSLEVNTLCGVSATTTLAYGALECDSSLSGRYVTLENSSPAKFQFAEVQVMALGTRKIIF